MFAVLRIVLLAVLQEESFDRFRADAQIPNAQEKFVAARRILKKGDDVYVVVHEESFFKSNTAAADFNKRYLLGYNDLLRCPNPFNHCSQHLRHIQYRHIGTVVQDDGGYIKAADGLADGHGQGLAVNV